MNSLLRKQLATCSHGFDRASSGKTPASQWTAAHCEAGALHTANRSVGQSVLSTIDYATALGGPLRPRSDDELHSSRDRFIPAEVPTHGSCDPFLQIAGPPSVSCESHPSIATTKCMFNHQFTAFTVSFMQIKYVIFNKYNPSKHKNMGITFYTMTLYKCYPNVLCQLG